MLKEANKKCKNFNIYNVVFFFLRKTPGDIIILHLWSVWQTKIGNYGSFFTLLPLPHMKITAKVTKSLHQDCGPCFLHLAILFLYMHFRLLLKIKSCCICCFSQQTSRLQTNGQLYILQGCSSVKSGFNMINKCHTLSAPCLFKSARFQSLLFYSELNEVCSNYV